MTVLIPIFVAHAAGSSSVRSGTAHGIELALPLTLDGTDGVVDDLLGCADAAVDFMIPDWFDLEKFALEFVSVQERHCRLGTKEKSVNNDMNVYIRHYYLAIQLTIQDKRRRINVLASFSSSLRKVTNPYFMLS